MKLERILYESEVYEASLDCNGYQIISPGERAGAVISEQDCMLLPPVDPGKILGVGWNFREHMDDMEVRRASGEAVVPAPVVQVAHPLDLTAAVSLSETTAREAADKDVTKPVVIPRTPAEKKVIVAEDITGVTELPPRKPQK